ncbi:5-oxoprolinase subunit PxpB [Marininema mesophilum]|nr:5-oxoprolinase subunit PxpB [Marininema mesophilum]
MPSIQPVGDTGVRIHFGDQIDPEIHKQIQSYCNALQARNLRGVIEWVPSYTAVTIYYHPYQIDYQSLIRELAKMKKNIQSLSEREVRKVVIPVVYGGEYGPDLVDVAEHNGLTPAEVIEIHSSASYLVYMMGFVPGFPYLGGMSESIATPRLEQPRATIPVGSVGIAGGQTGVYPLETPGGWRLIGRTPLRLYDPHRERPMLLMVGDQITFEPVSMKEYSEREADELKIHKKREQSNELSD